MPLWYYAKNDQQQGPVSDDEMKALIAAGTVTATDEVWREGLADWQPAGERPELFSPGETSNSATAERPVAPPPMPAAGNRGANPHASGGSDLADRLGGLNADLRKYARPLGQLILVFGFLMVIGFKGCDAVSQRYAERVKSQARLATAEFNYEYDLRQARLEVEREEISAKPDLSDYDRTRLESIDESLAELQEERNTEQRRLRRTTWQRLQHAADTADADRQQWALFYTMGFVAGTMVLTVGLLVVGLTGEGARTWICLGILAIIAFSLYVGGTAWIGRFLP